VKKLAKDKRSSLLALKISDNGKNIKLALGGLGDSKGKSRRKIQRPGQVPMS